jgi:hypothetical protein
MDGLPVADAMAAVPGEAMSVPTLKGVVRCQRGNVLALESAQGPIARVVVRDYGDVVAVCTKEEYALAKKMLREPISVGFKKRDIIKRLR